MRKWWVLLIIVVVLAAGAIIAGRDHKAPKQTAADSDQVVVVVNSGPKQTDKVEVERFKETIARFNKEYPNIKITWTDRGYRPDTFATSMAGGTAEDVISLYATEGYVIDRGYALDLTKFVNEWEDRDSLNKELLKVFMRHGRIYGLPGDGYIMALAYNKKMFREAGLSGPPNTWEEFVACAQKLTNRQKGISGYGIKGREAQAGWEFLNWVWQAGGDFEKKIGGKWRAVFAEPEAIKALNFIKDLRWKHDVLQPNLLVNIDDLFPLFAGGQIGMMAVTGTTYNIEVMVNKYNMPLKDIGLALLPAGPAGRANQLGGSYFIINPTSPPKVQEAAFKWITWKIKDDWNPESLRKRLEDARKQGLATSVSCLPIFKGEIFEQAKRVLAEYNDVVPSFPDAQLAAKYIHPEPPFFAQQLYAEYLGPAIEATLTNKNANPKELLRNAAEKFEKRFLSQVN